MNSHQRPAGLVLFIASLLLVIATAIEFPLLEKPTDVGPGFWAFLVLFGLASIGYAVAGAVLGQRGGSAGTSMVGRIAFFGFGIFWLVAQTLYAVGRYLAPSEGVLAVSLAFNILMIFALLVGAIVAVRQRIASPLARWSLLAAAIISAVTGATAGAITSPVAITVLHIVSAVGLAVAGLGYLIRRPAASSSVSATAARSVA